MIRSLLPNTPSLLIVVIAVLLMPITPNTVNAQSTNRITFDNIGLKRAVSEWLQDPVAAEVTYGPIEDWNTWQVTDMSRLFQGATNFDANLNGWDTAQVTSLAFAFAGAESFDSPLGDWDLSSCTDLTSTFHGASSFTGESIGSWNVANVESFETTFLDATSFVGSTEMEAWDFSSANTMYGMFYGATSFDLNVNNWNVANVQYTNSLFTNAASFSQPVCFASGIHPKAKYYEAFCSTNGAAFDKAGSCSTQPHQSIQAYSQACDNDGILEEKRVFARPEDFVGGLGGTGSFSSSGLAEDLAASPPGDADGPEEPVITAGLQQQDASAAPAVVCNSSNTLWALAVSTFAILVLGY